MGEKSCPDEESSSIYVKTRMLGAGFEKTLTA